MTSGRIESWACRPWQARRRGSPAADLISFGVAAAASIVALALQRGSAPRVPSSSPPPRVSVMALAYVLGEATEQAGTASGPRLASLLNATFGNLPELIIVVLTVREGLIDVARASIIGSVIGNILLVLGASILLGGLRNGSMAFDRRSVGTNASMLVARRRRARPAVALRRARQHDAPRAGALSYGVAGIMVVLYAAYLVYSFTQPAAAGPRGRRPLGRALGADHARRSRPSSRARCPSCSCRRSSRRSRSSASARSSSAWSSCPLVGNVPEHWAAVRIARGGNLDFSMSIAFNSGLQVALAGTAIAVAAGAVLGHEVLIVFPPIELALLGAATIMTGDPDEHAAGPTGSRGSQLLAIYVIAALAFWYL